MVKRQDTLQKAFDNANNKDIQLQETLTHLIKARKKTKQLLIEEKNKLQKYERVPEENKAVSFINEN